MFAYLDDDQDMSSYDIIYVDKHGAEQIILGTCDMPDDVATWGFYRINNIGTVPTIYGAVLGLSPNGNITLNTKLPGFNFDGKPFIKMALRYGRIPVKPVMGPDWCKKCEVKAQFFLRALKCPDCGDLLGGC